MLVYDVASYGAVGDGTTDDSDAIQDAHDDAYAAGGGIVAFGAGAFAVGSTLNFNSRVGIRGAGRSSTFISALSNNNMLVWNGGSASYGAATIEECCFLGNDVAPAGVIVGYSAHNQMRQVQIQNCVNDGLVLSNTQNGLFEQVLVQDCGLANYRLAGFAWNNVFVRCGSNEPGSSGYHLLSRISTSYNTLTGGGETINNNRHNTWFHPLFERGSPINLVRLEDDDGGSTFYDMEFEGGSSGNPQVYIGASSNANQFIAGNIQTGGVTGLTYAFDNYGYGTQILNVIGVGWSGVDWVRNASSSAGVLVRNPLGGNQGTINDSYYRSLSDGFTFYKGTLFEVIADQFMFSPVGSDDEVLGPLFWAGGRVHPLTDDTYKLGNSTYRWSDLYAVNTHQNVATLNGVNVSALPAVDGTIAYINDSSTSTIGASISGGGSNHVLGLRKAGTWVVVA